MAADKKSKKDDTKEVVKSVGKGAASTVVLQGKIIKKIWLNTIGALWVRFWRATLVGKIFVLVGLSGCVVISVLAFKYAIDLDIVHKEYILVTTSKANVRDSVSTKSEIMRKTRRGEELTQKGEADEWWFVQGKDWEKPGWIHKNIAKKEQKVLFAFNYEMQGYGWAFLAAFIILYIGFCLRKSETKKK